MWWVYILITGVLFKEYAQISTPLPQVRYRLNYHLGLSIQEYSEEFLDHMKHDRFTGRGSDYRIRKSDGGGFVINLYAASSNLTAQTRSTLAVYRKRTRLRFRQIFILHGGTRWEQQFMVDHQI